MLEINRQSKKAERLPQFLADTAHPFRLNPWLLELDSGMLHVQNKSFLKFQFEGQNFMCH